MDVSITECSTAKRCAPYHTENDVLTKDINRLLLISKKNYTFVAE